jgi:hypothetical protein
LIAALPAKIATPVKALAKTSPVAAIEPVVVPEAVVEPRGESVTSVKIWPGVRIVFHAVSAIPDVVRGAWRDVVPIRKRLLIAAAVSSDAH